MATTKYNLETERPLGRGLKLAFLDYTFGKTTAGKTAGTAKITLTSFSKILFAGVAGPLYGGAAGKGYEAAVDDITNNIIRLKLYHSTTGTAAFAIATSLAMTNMAAKLVVLGYQ